MDLLTLMILLGQMSEVCLYFHTEKGWLCVEEEVGVGKKLQMTSEKPSPPDYL